MDLVTLALAKSYTDEVVEENDGAGSGSVAQVQADWNQNDETAVDFIKNKPEIATDDDIMDMLTELNTVEPVVTADNSILTSSTGEIYSL